MIPKTYNQINRMSQADRIEHIKDLENQIMKLEKCISDIKKSADIYLNELKLKKFYRGGNDEENKKVLFN